MSPAPAQDEAERVSAGPGLEGAPFPGAWSARGACRSLPHRIFFPTRGEDYSAARAVCAACPVVASCCDYALALPGLKGIWGGLSETSGLPHWSASGHAAS